MAPSDSFRHALEPAKLLALAGTDGSPEGTFTRRFPRLPKQGSSNPLLEEGLTRLGEKLMGDKQPAQGDPLPPFAGYTYLGQFIDHDITFDLTPLKDAQPIESKTANFRAPFLDLDQVYGGGPNLSPFLYQNKSEFREAERFLIGETNPSALKPQGSANDLPRNSEGVALTGDPRQDENLILGQLHVVFLKLHNWLLDHPEQLAFPHYANAGSLFAKAQRVVRWHYQWIVVHDFLAQILDPTVHLAVLEAEKIPLSQPAPVFQIPIEFSVAAFRFGHSMVRENYVINSHHSTPPIDLIRLLNLTGHQGLVGAETPPRLPEEWRVEWPFFFTGAGQHSGLIDTTISPSLYGIPPRVQKLFTAPVPLPEEERRLPILTLRRGARVGLPSGQAVAAELGCDVLRGDRILLGTSPEQAEILQTYGFLEDTPLWYYILKEAEILGKGVRLGPTGSKLIAEVFIGALRSTPDSYLSAGGTWVPTLALAPPKIEPKDYDISDLLFA